MVRPTPIKVNIQSPIRDLRVERCIGFNDRLTSWRIWITANGDFTLGTFIELANDGKIRRVTWHADGTETIHEGE
jgi:hypothetical protein